MDKNDFDELFEEAAKLVISERAGSASLIQRRLEVGYSRAARLLDQLEDAGILSHSEGNKPREVMISSFEELPSDYKERKQVKYFVMGREERLDWSPKKISSPFTDFQKEFKNSKDVRIPVGINSKGKIVSCSLGDVGHIYIFKSPLCKSNELLKNMVEVMVNTYTSDALKLIVADDSRVLVSDDNVPHLLTSVIVDNRKVENALAWAVVEREKRLKIFQEIGVDSFENYNKNTKTRLPEIVCVINNISGFLTGSDEVMSRIETLVSSGHLSGIHMIVCSPLLEKKHARLMTSFPTKIIFKTFSTTQADLLGTDDAFELQSPNDFLFVPAYGKMEKLSVR